MGQRDWAGRQAEEIGARVAARRKAAGLSQTELASRCVAMGLPSMTRRIVVALEAGERESIPLSELTVIAAVLGVSPVDLIVPFTAETAEVLPDLKLAPWEAARWWSGEAALVDGVFTLERRLGPARLYQDHAQMMQVLADEEIDEEIYGRLRRRNMRQSGTLTEQELALMRTADTVRTIRQMLREEGLVSPDLPERFKWLDT